MTDTHPAEGSPSRRKPSRSFAVYPLRGATEGVKTAGASGGDHSRDAFASYLGHETTNSGGFKRKLASMKDWGLIETRGDRVVITDLGMRIAHPRTDDDEQGAIREAFLQAEVFAETYNDLAKGVDLSAERIGSMGVHEHGISPGAKADFARSFVESAAFAGLGQRNPDGSIRLAATTPGTGQGRDDERDRGGDRLDRDNDSVTQRRTRDIGDGPPAAIRQEWDVANGSVLFEVRLDGALPSAAFATLGEVMRTVEELVSSLGHAKPAATSTPTGPTKNGSPGDAPD